jgi:putative MATE family efflux protein
MNGPNPPKKRRKKLNFGRIFAGDVDLTTGNLLAKMAIFTFPIILLSLLQLLYSSADEYVVANFGGGYQSMNAIGSNSSLISLLIGLFVGISIGANVVVARAKGAQDEATAHRAIEASMVLSLFFGIAVAVIGYFLAPYLLRLMETPSEFLDKATIYLRWYFVGLPFLMVFNFGAAILRAMGDSKRPLYALIFCGTLNVGLNFLFVIVFNLDVAGVAITTVISEFLEALLVVVFLMTGRGHFAYFSFKDLALYEKETRAVLKNGIPAGLQSFIFSASNVFIQWGVNSFSNATVSNDVAVAGNTASVTIEGYIWIVLDAFAVASVAIVAQNYGAGKKENIRKALWMSLVYVSILGLTLGGLAALFRNQLCGIFITPASFKDSAGVVDLAKYQASLEVGGERLTLIGLTYFLDGIMDTSSAFCQGLGHAKTPPLITFFAVTVLRIAFITTAWESVAFFHTLPWLWSTWPISWCLAIATYYCFIPRYLKKADAEIDKKNAAASSLALGHQ